MTERERLIETICEGLAQNCGGNCTLPNNMYCQNCHILADYLLANGVIVLPVKVGYTVYNIDGECVSDSVVIECKIDECATGFKSQTYYGEEMEFDDYDIGKCIFLTKEEAEKALKERKKCLYAF